MAKRVYGHQLTHRTTTWWSEYDHKRLAQRARRAGAKTPSAYIRAAALGGAEFEMPAFRIRREQLNAVINLARVLETYPATKLVNETLAEAKATLRRMCRP